MSGAIMVELRKELEAITGLPVSIGYSEDRADSITLVHLGTVPSEAAFGMLTKRATYDISNVSIAINCKRYETLIGTLKHISNRFDQTFGELGGLNVMLSDQQSYYERFVEDARRHVGTVDYRFLHKPIVTTSEAS